MENSLSKASAAVIYRKHLLCEENIQKMIPVFVRRTILNTPANISSQARVYQGEGCGDFWWMTSIAYKI